MPFAPGVSFNEIYVSVITANRSASFTAESGGSAIESKLTCRVQAAKPNKTHTAAIFHSGAEFPFLLVFFTIITDKISAAQG